jgi:hypothetical protein
MAAIASGADPSLVRLAALLDAHHWAAELVDDRWRLVWVSEELRTLYGAREDGDLGLGLHVLEARVRGMTVGLADRERWLRTNLPMILSATEGGREEVAKMLSPELVAARRDRGGDTAAALVVELRVPPWRLLGSDQLPR